MALVSTLRPEADHTRVSSRTPEMGPRTRRPRDRPRADMLTPRQLATDLRPRSACCAGRLLFTYKYQLSEAVPNWSDCSPCTCIGAVCICVPPYESLCTFCASEEGLERLSWMACCASVTLLKLKASCAPPPICRSCELRATLRKKNIAQPTRRTTTTETAIPPATATLSSFGPSFRLLTVFLITMQAVDSY